MRWGTVSVMATVTQFWAPHANQNGLYQALGTLEWYWPLGNNSNYWGYAIRPQQANMQVEIERQWTTSDNDLNQVEHFILTVSDPVGREFRPSGNGGLLQFTAIKVEA
jgi:hypothetical protein